MDNKENEVKAEQSEINKATESQPEQVVTKEKKSGWGLKIGIGVIVAALAIGGVSFFAMGGADRIRLNQSLSLANRYLEELDYEQAIAYFEEAIEIDPKSDEAYLGLTEAYAARGDYESAIEALEEGIEQTGSEELKAYLEEILAEQEAVQAADEAEEEDTEAIAENTEDTEVLESSEEPEDTEEEELQENTETEEGARHLEECLSLGNRYLEEMEYEQAVACFEEVISIDPKNADAYLGIVEAYIRAGEYELALDYAQRGYDATGDDRLAEKVDMLQNGNVTRSDGLIVMMTVYDDAGEIMFRHEYTYDRENRRNSVSHYDKSGNLIKTLPISDNESYGYISDTGELFKISYTYEDNLITKLYYDEDDVTITSWELTEQDDNGVSVRSIQGYGDNVGSEDEVTGYEEYSYDENGNAVTSAYDSDYQLLYKQVWERDEQGNTQRYVCYDENGNIEWYCLYEYDKNGKMVSEREYDAEDNLVRETVYE